jgi:hypothetical protein
MHKGETIVNYTNLHHENINNKHLSLQSCPCPCPQHWILDLLKVKLPSILQDVENYKLLGNLISKCTQWTTWIWMYEVMIQMMKYMTYSHININKIALLNNNLQFEINIYSFKKDGCMDGLGKVWIVNWLNGTFGENPKQMKFGGWNNSFWSLQMNWEKNILGNIMATFTTNSNGTWLGKLISNFICVCVWKFCGSNIELGRNQLQRNGAYMASKI